MTATDASLPASGFTASVTIDPAVKAACPAVVVGCVEAAVVNGTDDPLLWAEIDACVANLQQTMAIEDIAKIPAVQALRRAYRALGKDPTRYRGSQEALLRRILRGLGLYRINTVVDINNLVSIECRRSLGVFDRDRIGDALVLRAAAPGETYRGIGKDELNLEGLPVYADADGGFGSTTSDSERVRVTVETKRIFLVVTAFDGPDGLPAVLDRIVALLRAHAGADSVATAIVA
jgi:DNA/RNA-binding domain of Phe-tRNA-synthetase-like protein